MQVSLLFRKKTPLTRWGLPWLNGAETHPYPARRNHTGQAVISAILVRALLAGLEGRLAHAAALAPEEGAGVVVQVASHSRPGLTSLAWWHQAQQKAGLPHGAPNRVTYHLGVLGLSEALLHPHEAEDLWDAYLALLTAFQKHGKTDKLGPALGRASDELYYWLRYRDGVPGKATCRLEALQVTGNHPGYKPGEALNLACFTDAAQLQTQLLGAGEAARSAPGPGPSAAPAPQAESRPDPDGMFVGWQADALTHALAAQENVLLAGPTGTGKTMLTEQVVLASGAALVTVEGKEGLLDLDFLGALLPQPDGSRQWVDGPVLRAMRLAQSDPVVLFLDELNRIPRPHLNLLLGLLNPKSSSLCQRQGLAVTGPGPFYVLEVPMTSEVVWCPAAHLRVVAAGNFGRAYQVYALDPAVRRRFDTVLEFSYLAYAEELRLLQRVTTLPENVAEGLVKLAQETRRLQANGELPGCLDTASLLSWGRKCARTDADTVPALMQMAAQTWGDLVCGRDHTGRVTPGSFQALSDYLLSLGLPGEAS